MLFKFIKERYPDFTVKKSEDSYDDECVLLLNPQGSDDIMVTYSEITADYNEYTFFFSTQHAHFDDKEILAEYIDRFISGSTGAIEFYNDGKDIHGGDVEIPTEGIKSITDWADWLDDTDDNLIGLEVKITTWDGVENVHGVFVLKDGKAVLITNE